jgi:hypothetical protein
MANLWSKAVGIIHKKKYTGQPLQAAMKDPETKELYEQMKGKAGVTGKMKPMKKGKGKKSRKNRKTRGRK